MIEEKNEGGGVWFTKKHFQIGSKKSDNDGPDELIAHRVNPLSGEREYCFYVIQNGTPYIKMVLTEGKIIMPFFPQPEN